MAKVLILGLRAANLTHSVPANVFQWELLRDGKGREKEVGGNEARGEEKKKKEKVTLFSALLLYFDAENQHVSLQPPQERAAPRLLGEEGALGTGGLPRHPAALPNARAPRPGLPKGGLAHCQT